MKTCAVILGSYVNAYAIAHELKHFGVKEIVLISSNKKLCWYSSYFSKKFLIGLHADDLLNVFLNLSKTYDKLVVYPTDDWFVETLVQLNDQIEHFAFLPINPQQTIACSDKFVQYEYCKKYNIPFPKSIKLVSVTDLKQIGDDIPFPLIIKPSFRADLTVSVFRSKRIDSMEEFHSMENELQSFLQQGLEFIVSEIIPGTSSGNIYAYCGYVSKEGQILNEWTGKKLSQFPDDYGVYSSASNEAPEVVLEQGRTLVKALNCYGFIEPEFKYDHRDGQYKLMEVNLRPMMWHELGFRTGVAMHYTQWCLATNQPIPSHTQDKSKKVVLRYFRHEILNLIKRDNYWATYKSIAFQKHVFHAGIYWDDLLPAFVDFYGTVKNVAYKLLKN